MSCKLLVLKTGPYGLLPEKRTVVGERERVSQCLSQVWIHLLSTCY